MGQVPWPMALAPSEAQLLAVPEKPGMPLVVGN